jgi:hypothetical protein
VKGAAAAAAEPAAATAADGPAIRVRARLIKSVTITFTPSSSMLIRELIGMEQMPTRLGIEYAPCMVKISAKTPNKIRM